MVTFSIIIPIYNTKISYLKRIINCIRSQSYKNYELILINDNSTFDDVNLFLKELKLNKNEKYFFNTKNIKAGATRNRGILESKNDYIIFIDSDDYISNDYLLKISNLITNNPSYDIYHINYVNDYNHEKIKNNDFVQIKNIRINGVMPWLFIINKKFIINNNIFFDEKLDSHEDQLFLLNIFLHTNNVLTSDLFIYFYNRNNELSIMNNMNFIKFLLTFDKLLSLFWNDKYLNFDLNNWLINEFLVKYIYFIGYWLYLQIPLFRFLKYHKFFKNFKKIKAIKTKIKIKLSFKNEICYFFNFSFLFFILFKVFLWMKQIKKDYK